MNRFLAFLGLAPKPITMTFDKVSPEMEEKMGCGGVWTTESSLTSVQLDVIKRYTFNGAPSDGEQIVIDAAALRWTDR